MFIAIKITPAYFAQYGMILQNLVKPESPCVSQRSSCPEPLCLSRPFIPSITLPTCFTAPRTLLLSWFPNLHLLFLPPVSFHPTLFFSKRSPFIHHFLAPALSPLHSSFFRVGSIQCLFLCCHTSVPSSSTLCSVDHSDSVLPCSLCSWKAHGPHHVA